MTRVRSSSTDDLDKKVRSAAFPRTSTVPPTLESLRANVRPTVARPSSSAAFLERREIERTTAQCQRSGLLNLGNTCFMNTCLQCLFSIPPLVQFINCPSYESCVNPSGKSPMHGELIEVFASLLRKVCVDQPGTQQSRVASPAAFKKVVGQWSPQFAGFCQQDAQEFLRFLLDGLHEDTNVASHGTGSAVTEEKKCCERKEGKEDTRCDGSDNASFSARESKAGKDRLSREAWATHKCRNESFIHGIFGGQLESCVECLNCAHRSFCFDIFLDLSLPIAQRGQAATQKASFLRRVSRPLSSSLPKRLLSRLRSMRRSEAAASAQAAAVTSDSSAASVTVAEPASASRKPPDRATAKSAMRECTAATTSSEDPVLELSECLDAFSGEEELDATECYNCERCKRQVRCRKSLTVYRFPKVLVIHLKRFKFNLDSRDKLSTRIKLPPEVLDLSPYASEAVPNADGTAPDPPPKYLLVAVAQHMGTLGGGHYTALCRDVRTSQWYSCNDSIVKITTLEESYDERAAYVLFFLRLDQAGLYFPGKNGASEKK